MNRRSPLLAVLLVALFGLTVLPTPLATAQDGPAVTALNGGDPTAADGQTLFCAVQHPGDGGTLAAPISEFPDPGRGARPAMISIWKTDGGPVGS